MAPKIDYTERRQKEGPMQCSDKAASLDPLFRISLKALHRIGCKACISGGKFS